jgi:hypothetical protein
MFLECFGILGTCSCEGLKPRSYLLSSSLGGVSLILCVREKSRVRGRKEEGLFVLEDILDLY